MLMTTRLFFQRPRSDLKGLLRWLCLFCGITPSVTLAATLHAIILADTTDSSLYAHKDMDNIKQWVANISEATGLELKETVINGENGFSNGSHEKVKNVVAELPVMAKEDVVIFYYAGHGVNKNAGSRWPAMDVEGEGTAPDKLIELSWVKQTLSNKSPRLLIAMADTCNEFLSEPSRGEGTILGEGAGPYKQAYRKLFLGYEGVIMASGSIPDQLSFSNKDGGRFTQAFLTSIKGELKSADPDWKNIETASVKNIPVEDPVEAKDQPVQTPQMKLEVVKVAGFVEDSANQSVDVQLPPVTTEEGNDQMLLSHHQPPLKPDETVCPQQTSGWGACYLNAEAEGGRKWNVFVEEKVWFTTWQGWEQAQPGSGKGDDTEAQTTSFELSGADHFVSLTTEPTLVSILTVGYRYDKLSVGVSLLPKKSYSFPTFTRQPIHWKNTTTTIEADGTTVNYKDDYKDSNEQITATAEREEMDVTVGYSILPELQLGVGFKRATLNYQYHHFSDNPFSEVTGYGGNWQTEDKYKTYGVSLNIGGQICLANWLGTDVSMFGNFSYGALKTTWKENESDYTTYHSTDLGLSWGLPKLGQVKPEVRFGYRAQTLYTQVSRGDAVDTTEGFTLGLRVIY